MVDTNTLAASLVFACGKHDSEPMNMFCIDNECDKRGLLCALCEASSHEHHRILSLKVLLNDVSQDLEAFTNGKSMARFSAGIDEEYLKCIQLLEKLGKKDQTYMVRESINNYFAKIRDVVLRPPIVNFKRLVGRVEQKQVTAEDVNSFFLKYRQEEKEKDSPLTNYEICVKELIKELSNKYTELEKAIKSEDKIQNILPIFVFPESEPKVNYKFSDTKKHTSHTITNEKLIVQKNNYNTNFALIQPLLQGNKKSFRCKTVSIKVVRLTSWITMGICHQKIVNANNYYFNTGTIGHGAYVISNDGYSWHHSSSNLNAFVNNWSFSQGDTVHICWDPQSKLIKFTKNDQPNDSYELTFEFIPGDKLCFCVSLSSHDESVEIV